VAARQPRIASVFALRGYAYGRSGDLAAAEADFEIALTGPEDTRFAACMNRGAVYLLHGQPDQAINDFQHARELRPKSSDAAVNLARAYFDKQDLKSAADILAARVVAAAHSPAAHRLRAHVFYAQLAIPGANEKVIAELDEAIRWSAPRTRELAEVHLDKGRLYHTHGQLQKALAEYEKAIEASSDLPEALALHGITLRQMDRYDLARESFDRFFEVERLSELANRSIAKRRQPTTEHDADDLWRFSAPQQSIRMLATAHRERGICRLVLGDIAGAEYDFGAMLHLVPDPDSLPNPFDREAWRFARARMGWLYLDKSSKLAEQQFSAILEHDPDSAEAYAGRGYARATMRQIDGAIKDAEAAREKSQPAASAESPTTAASDRKKVLYYIAAVYGAVHAKADDRKVAEGSGEQAIETLRELLSSLGPSERDRRLESVRRDEAFRSLQELPAWKELVGDAK
jgi:tetratricopeptide (TPR) repeat protein